MNIMKIAMIEALIDEIADRNGNVKNFPSYRRTSNENIM